MCGAVGWWWWGWLWCERGGVEDAAGHHPPPVVTNNSGGGRVRQRGGSRSMPGCRVGSATVKQRIGKLHIPSHPHHSLSATLTTQHLPPLRHRCSRRRQQRQQPTSADMAGSRHAGAQHGRLVHRRWRGVCHSASAVCLLGVASCLCALTACQLLLEGGGWLGCGGWSTGRRAAHGALSRRVAVNQQQCMVLV